MEPNTENKYLRNPVVFGLTVLFFALLSRSIYLWQLRGQEFFWYPVGDGAIYFEQALDIFHGNWLGGEVFFQSPFYPYFIAAIFKFFGQDLAVLRIVQMILGSCACLFLALSARNFFGTAAGWIAGFMAAVYPLAFFYDGLIQKTFADFFFASLTLFFISRSRQASRRADFFLLGACLGLFALNRDNALVLLPVLLGWIWIRCRRQAWSRSLIFLAGVLLILTPIGLRNWSIGGSFVLTSNFGPNFFIGNNPQATGLYQPLSWGRGNASAGKQDAVEIAEKALGKKLQATQVSAFWFKQAWKFIRQQPGRWGKLLLRKCALTWQAKEFTDSDSLRLHLDASPWLGFWYKVFPFGVLVPLALLGLLLSWRSGSVAPLLFLMIGSFFASVALFFVMTRYRFVLVPFLLPLAAVFFPALGERWREKRFALLGLAAAAALIVTVGINRPLMPVSLVDDRALGYYNIAVAQVKMGQWQKAEANFRRAVAGSPRSPQYLLGLAQLLSRQGRDEEALPYGLAALEAADFPELFALLNQWGNRLLEQRKPALATRLFRKLLEKRPADPRLNAQLARALLQSGR